VLKARSTAAAVPAALLGPSGEQPVDTIQHDLVAASAFHFRQIVRHPKVMVGHRKPADLRDHVGLWEKNV
jgi:hypothetical protein